MCISGKSHKSRVCEINSEFNVLFVVIRFTLVLEDLEELVVVLC